MPHPWRHFGLPGLGGPLPCWGQHHPVPRAQPQASGQCSAEQRGLAAPGASPSAILKPQAKSLSWGVHISATKLSTSLYHAACCPVTPPQGEVGEQPQSAGSTCTCWKYCYHWITLKTRTLCSRQADSKRPPSLNKWCKPKQPQTASGPEIKPEGIRVKSKWFSSLFPTE